jgi:hypothetical protein
MVHSIQDRFLLSLKKRPLFVYGPTGISISLTKSHNGLFSQVALARLAKGEYREGGRQTSIEVPWRRPSQIGATFVAHSLVQGRQQLLFTVFL